MSDIAIRVEQLGKKYRRGVEKHGSLYERFQRSRNLEEFWALKNVSFEVKKGEIVGIIGRNGAGKSTLLKLLSRVTRPTEGHAQIFGRIGSLLEVGTGFHRELTGRENIYLNGAILGMSKAEVDNKFDEIVQFSGIEQFIDTPVKRYSSGMQVRLAFAVAAHLEPEVMVIDEVLAVGDAQFREKCLKKINLVAGQGRTILFVSHNMSVIQTLCQRVLLLQNGNITLDGRTDETIKQYLEFLSNKSLNPFEDNSDRSGAGGLYFTSARILNDSGQPSEHLVAGKKTTFEFDYKNNIDAKQANVAMTIYNHYGLAVANFDMTLTDSSANELGAEGKFICQIPRLPLTLGQYRVAVALQTMGNQTDLIPNALVFDVASSVFYSSGRTPETKYSSCMVEHNWAHKNTPQPSREKTYG